MFKINGTFTFKLNRYESYTELGRKCSRQRKWNYKRSMQDTLSRVLFSFTVYTYYNCERLIICTFLITDATKIPTISGAPIDGPLIVYKGNTTTIDCLVINTLLNQDLVQNYRWLKDGKYLRRYAGSSLVKTAQRDDTGTYSCEVVYVNNITVSSRAFEVLVLGE